MDSTVLNAMGMDVDMAIEMDLLPEVRTWALRMVTPLSMVSLTIHVLLINCRKFILWNSANSDSIGKQPAYSTVGLSEV